MTPAEEITAAVEKLRTARFTGAVTMTPTVAALVAAREPLADWLDATVYLWGSNGHDDHRHCPVRHCPELAALAAARAINGANR